MALNIDISDDLADAAVEEAILEEPEFIEAITDYAADMRDADCNPEIEKRIRARLIDRIDYLLTRCSSTAMRRLTDNPEPDYVEAE